MEKTFECAHCNFSTTVKANFIRHNGTSKHLKCMKLQNPTIIQETQKSNPNSKYLEELEKRILELENENKLLKTELQFKTIEIESKNEVIKSKDDFINYMKNIYVPSLSKKDKIEDKKDKEKIKIDKEKIKIDNEKTEIEYLEHELNALKKLEDKVDYLTSYSTKYAQKWKNEKLLELLC